jgi:hypothetical protein
MLDTIIPKSDQLNADDLIGGQTKTIKITNVTLVAGDQPVALSYEGDNGKPFKPGKSMRRVLVTIWGGDGKEYIGRSMTLYRDEKVKFGGVDVGGIRISHMSHIKEPITMALTAAKAVRKPFTVLPLVESVDYDFEKLKQAGRDAAAQGNAMLDEWIKFLPVKDKRRIAEEIGQELRQIAKEVESLPKNNNLEVK